MKTLRQEFIEVAREYLKKDIRCVDQAMYAWSASGTMPPHLDKYYSNLSERQAKMIAKILGRELR
jgi:hypothetical protein